MVRKCNDKVFQIHTSYIREYHVALLHASNEGCEKLKGGTIVIAIRASDFYKFFFFRLATSYAKIEVSRM